MTQPMDANEEQRERFEQALERKHEEAEAKAEANQPHTGGRPPDESGQSQETPPDARAKNEGHGKKTADKWNQ